jgi:hypothetical protein
VRTSVPLVADDTSPSNRDTFVLLCVPPNVTVHGPPALPVTVTLSTLFKASKAVSTCAAVAS